MPGWRPHREVIEMASGKNDKNSTRSPSSKAILLPIRLLVRLCKKMVQEQYQDSVHWIHILLVTPGGGEGVLPYKRLMGMCRWMGSYFNDWIHYKAVAFSIELLE